MNIKMLKSSSHPLLSYVVTVTCQPKIILFIIIIIIIIWLVSDSCTIQSNGEVFPRCDLNAALSPTHEQQMPSTWSFPEKGMQTSKQVCPVFQSITLHFTEALLQRKTCRVPPFVHNLLAWLLLLFTNQSDCSVLLF